MPSATDSPRSSSPGCHQDGSAYPQGDRYSAGTDALTMTEAEARHALALGPESAIGTPHPGTSLQRWAHMLGFGGHFLTKGRLYSIRFRDLRDARITYRRTQDTGPEHKPIRTAEHADEETTLIVGNLTYAGTGWKTIGDALLANTAADQARKRHQAGHEEIADQCNRTASGGCAA